MKILGPERCFEKSINRASFRKTYIISWEFWIFKKNLHDNEFEFLVAKAAQEMTIVFEFIR